jgi:hypothetical protein
VAPFFGGYSSFVGRYSWILLYEREFLHPEGYDRDGALQQNQENSAQDSTRNKK